MNDARVSRLSVPTDDNDLGVEDRISKLMARAREIKQEEGLFALFKATFLFLISPVYHRALFYLYENQVRTDSGISEPQPKINKNDLVFKVLSSNQEANELEAQGYKLRLNPNADYIRNFNNGVIAFCTFIGKELAAITWIIPSRQVQDRCGTPPIKIDYNHEALPRGVWVNPKYRWLEIHRYNERNRERYLAEMGITMIRAPIDYANKTGQGFIEALGGKKYGRGRLVRILWWRFWKETLDRDRTTM